jgi:hypothetical protein
MAWGSILHGVTSVRVIYVSVDVDGATKVAVSMMVHYPGAPTPSGDDGQWIIDNRGASNRQVTGLLSKQKREFRNEKIEYG